MFVIEICVLEKKEKESRPALPFFIESFFILHTSLRYVPALAVFTARGLFPVSGASEPEASFLAPHRLQ